MVDKRGLIIVCLLMVFLSSGVLAVDDLIALQGNVYNASGDALSSGNLVVSIYDAYSAGNLIYNSTIDFNNAISNGQYDIMIGNGSNDLTLEYGRLYYLELYVNNEAFTFNGSSRQVFQSSVGQINSTFVNQNQINSTHLERNIDLGNATNILSSAVNKSTGTNWIGQLLDVILDDIFDRITSVNNTGNLQNILNSTGIYSTYNSTYAGSINNASYLSTYNATYDIWAHNQTDGYSPTTYNATYAGYGTPLFATNGTNVYNDTANRFGFGTATPSAFFDVQYTAPSSGDYELGKFGLLTSGTDYGNAYVTLLGHRPGISQTNTAYINFDNYDAGEGTPQYTMARISGGNPSDSGSVGHLIFYTNRGASLTEAVRIDKFGNMNASENITADYFKGDGSLLTGISASGGGLFATNGTSVYNDTASQFGFGTATPSAFFQAMLGATDKFSIDATTTAHTDTDGVLAIGLTTATANVKGIFMSSVLGADDLDGVTGIYSSLTGYSGGHTLDNTANAFQALMAGDNQDTSQVYVAYYASAFNNNGGAGTAEALEVGTGYAYALYAESGDIYLGDGDLIISGSGKIGGDLNMTSNNITSMDCIIFDSGGKICSGA